MRAFLLSEALLFCLESLYVFYFASYSISFIVEIFICFKYVNQFSSERNE